MRIALGYPSAAVERDLLRGADRRTLLAQLNPSITPDTLLQLQAQVAGVHVADALIDYVQAVVRHTRESGHFEAGLSPRAAISLLRASQAWTLLQGRAGVLPEDVQAVLPAVAAHRLELRNAVDGAPGADLGRLLLEAVPVP
jgi:MoxR-like ATPase